MSKIIQCNCEHNFQDLQYGKNKRVANSTTKKSGERIIYRCTVCGKEH